MSRRRIAATVVVGRLWAAALFAVLALAGCGGRGVTADRRGAAPRDSSFAAVTFQRGRTPLEVSLARGRVLYGRYCAVCHGESGEGDGFNAYNIKATFGVTPTAFADSVAFSGVAPETILAAIRYGGAAIGKSPAMPPWGHTLSPGEITDVALYIRSDLANRKRAE